jgi:hypothetical protein
MEVDEAEIDEEKNKTHVSQKNTGDFQSEIDGTQTLFNK